jgi:ABC-2 type transport system permease protein
MSTLTGVRRLTRFTLRRDRLRLSLWVIGITSTIIISAASEKGLYTDQEKIESYVRLFGDNPALIAFAGPGYGFDDPNIGVILVNETQLWGMVIVALMSIFMVNRHTRAEEASERLDLVRANVVGRHAPTAASTIVIAGANLLIGLVSAVGFVATGYAVAGSIALAASFIAVGLVFAGITAVAAQLTSSSRATLGLSSAVLMVTFVLRAIGDIGHNVLTWLSPIGWGQAVRAYADERWWTIVLSVVVAVGLVAASFWLSARRDIGSGIIAARPGPAVAALWLTKPLGLAYRLHRGSLFAWPIGLFVTGIAFGSIGNDIDTMIEDNPQLADLLASAGGGSLVDAYWAVAMTMMALVACGFTISTTLALRTEEGEGRAESMLAGPLPRDRWAGSHLLLALAGTVVTIAAGGAGVGIGYAVVSDDPGQVVRLTAASLVTVPAAMVLLGLTVALYGLVPRLALLAWGVLAFVSLVDYLGEVLRLPQWVRRISPFEHLPDVPAQSMQWPPLLALTALAAALTALGLWGLRRRDIAVH